MIRLSLLPTRTPLRGAVDTWAGRRRLWRPASAVLRPLTLGFMKLQRGLLGGRGRSLDISAQEKPSKAAC